MEASKALEFFAEVAAKTQAGRIPWEPTATDELVAAIGGQFTLRLFPYEAYGSSGHALILQDAEGRELVRVDDNLANWSTLRDLYQAARHQALRVDERLEQVMGQLGKL